MDSDFGPTIFVVVSIVIGAVLLVSAVRGFAEGGAPEARGCFSAQLWSADDGDRPCVRVNLYEDGSYRAIVREADGDKWRKR